MIWIDTHRVAWEFEAGGFGEKVTCDEEEARQQYRALAGMIRGGKVGRVSWSVNNFQQTYVTTPGFEWGSVRSRRAAA